MLPEIIYEDADLIVCYKPAGMAAQTRRLGQQDMETWLKNYRARKKETPYIGVVHRLDQPVEGLMVFGKTPKASAALSKQVQTREIGKYYYAVGSRKISEEKIAEKMAEKSEDKFRAIPEKDTLTDYLTFDQKSNVGKVTGPQDKNAKKAVLDYEILGRKVVEEEERLCFKITLHTGRHHQIRLQLSHLGYPLLGDSKYGGSQVTGSARGSLALCSFGLDFSHPSNGKKMSFRIGPKNPLMEGYEL